MFPSGFAFENARNVSLSGCQSGPCPSCGGMGHVPDGVYDLIDNAIRLLQGPDRTVNELQRLAAVLREAKARGATADEVGAAIRRQLPEIRSLADILPKTRAELYAFMAILLTIITLAISEKEKGNTVNIETQQIITTVIDQSSQLRTDASNARRKVGRNAPSLRGGRKRLKDRHGKNANN